MRLAKFSGVCTSFIPMHASFLTMLLISFPEPPLALRHPRPEKAANPLRIVAQGRSRRREPGREPPCRAGPGSDPRPVGSPHDLVVADGAGRHGPRGLGARR